MERLIAYFSDMPSLHRLLILVGGLTLFSLLETAQPLFDLNYKRLRHALPNLFFTLTTIIVNLPLAFLLVKSSDWVTANEFGLLYMVELPTWLFAIIGVMLMDLIGAYLIHYIEHHVKWMWQFHVIHHSDQHIDTTSGNRHHPGESVFRFVFTIIATLVVGAPIWMIFVYQTLSAILTQFNHANVQLPEWLEKILRVVIVTPSMHRSHHHYRLPYSDSNYGNIFSFWDRMFGTLILVDNKKVRYGLDTYMAPKESQDVWTMLKLPFQKYRPTPQYEQEEKL
ncbi:MAG: sterol desaturase family protein [Saprospiraceae bacterium]|nr:sterol desaturase family protein [Saprospiraceae bacterium]